MRMKFLIEEYPERKEEIIMNMPRKYKELDLDVMKKLHKEVLIQLYKKREELLLDGLDRVDIEINILENQKFFPTELCRPKRYEKKGKTENEVVK